MDGDLEVTIADIEEIVLDILETQYGDVDLDGDRDQDDMDVIENAITTPPSCNADASCGWRDGDMNCDGRLDGKDVQAFVTALLSAASYNSQYPHCLINNADVNDDNAVNNGDVTPFAALLTNG